MPRPRWRRRILPSWNPPRNARKTHENCRLSLGVRRSSLLVAGGARLGIQPSRVSTATVDWRTERRADVCYRPVTRETDRRSLTPFPGEPLIRINVRPGPADSHLLLFGHRRVPPHVVSRFARCWPQRRHPRPGPEPRPVRRRTRRREARRAANAERRPPAAAASPACRGRSRSMRMRSPPDRGRITTLAPASTRRRARRRSTLRIRGFRAEARRRLRHASRRRTPRSPARGPRCGRDGCRSRRRRARAARARRARACAS